MKGFLTGGGAGPGAWVVYTQFIRTCVVCLY